VCNALAHTLWTAHAMPPVSRNCHSILSLDALPHPFLGGATRVSRG